MTYSERSRDFVELEGSIVLTEQDAREAARLLRLLSDAVGKPVEIELPSASDCGTEQKVSRARIIFHARKARTRFLNRAMFGEPAWDILLALFINDASGRVLTATKLADYVDEPFSTVVRWLNYLEKERLVERIAHPNDRRTHIVRLLEKGRSAMDGYLAMMPPSGPPRDCGD